MNLEEYCMSTLNTWNAKTMEEFIIAFVNLDDDKMDALTPDLKNTSLYQRMITHQKIFAIISNICNTIKNKGG